MSTDNHHEIIGQLGADPELRFTPSGVAVATFNVAVGERRRDNNTGEWKDAGTTWYRVIAWNAMAEHVAESLQRGNRVMITGVMRQRSWENKEGVTQYTWELTADDIGASLKYSAVKPLPADRGRATESDPWSSDPQSPAEPLTGDSAPSHAGAGQGAAEPSRSPARGRSRSGVSANAA
jgi:single-strand DNA-binding protein